MCENFELAIGKCIFLSQFIFVDLTACNLCNEFIKLWLNQISTHTMSMFNLPTILSKDLGLMMIRFWWGRKKKVWWDGKSFAKIRNNKIWDLKVFNMALHAKHGLRLIHEKDSLAQAVLKAEYNPQCSSLEAKCKPNASYTWRSILGGRSVLEKGSHWRGR